MKIGKCQFEWLEISDYFSFSEGVYHNIARGIGRSPIEAFEDACLEIKELGFEVDNNFENEARACGANNNPYLKGGHFILGIRWDASEPTLDELIDGLTEVFGYEFTFEYVDDNNVLLHVVGKKSSLKVKRNNTGWWVYGVNHDQV
jgi:hypothetical protein